MKKITLMTMMFVGLLMSCSVDDALEVNGRDGNVTAFSNQDSGNCVDGGALGGSATLSSYTGPEIMFNWNNNVAYAADKTYVSYIELKNDAGCPEPAGATPVEASYPIDVFNSSSLVIPGVSAKCFYWRIVVNVYSGSVLECTTATEWMGATYVQ